MKLSNWLVVLIFGLTSCEKSKPTPTSDAPQDQTASSELQKQCNDKVGPPRVIEVTPRIFVAIGYDLANVTLVKTSEGNVIIDAGMNPKVAAVMKKALLEKSPGPIKALIFTHTHLDHVGGASIWVEKTTKIWATSNFRDRFFSQYGMLRNVEKRRAQRMYGQHMTKEQLPCLAIGARIDFDATNTTGARMPTDTFDTQTSFKIGDRTFDLTKAPGESADALMVHVPEEKAVLIGDNFYQAFPNLYTIRGTSFRPVDSWIASLDHARRLDPEYLIAGHTTPLSSKAIIRPTLRDYRDAIAWVYSRTIALANFDGTPDDAAEITLPSYLAKSPNLGEFYGQTNWSARGIYSGLIGWFDGRAEDLDPMNKTVAAKKEIEMMGGKPKVLEEAVAARTRGDLPWSTHLFNKLLLSDISDTNIKPEIANNFRLMSEQTKNSNGRAYLYESAYEMEHGLPLEEQPALDNELVKEIPLQHIMQLLAVRTDLSEDDLNVDETIEMYFTDVKETYFVTQRHGIVEVVKDAPLPGTAKPIANVTTDSLTFKRLANKSLSRTVAVASGKFKISGSLLGYAKFMMRFQID